MTFTQRIKKEEKENLSGKIKLLKGFTLIEALIVVFLITLVAITFYSVFTLGVKHIMESKNRLGAVAFANEKMEIVRNLDFAGIGTKKRNPNGSYSYGIPAGDILEDETVNVNTREFYVHTLIQYIDDTYDGKEDGSPDDAIPNDYKRVSIRVAWDPDPETSKFVYLVSTFVPTGVEKPVSGGTLSINVIDKQGIGIGQALVRITNSQTSTDISTMTDSTGNITFVGAPASSNNYFIRVSKSGYYSVETYPPYPTTPDFRPVDEHATVVEGKLNPKSIKTDKTSELTIFSKDPFGNSIPAISYNLKGGKKIGDTIVVSPNIPEPVFDYVADLVTGADGKNVLEGRCFGSYYLTPGTNANYLFIKTDNNQPKYNLIDLQPDSTLEVGAIFADNRINSLFVAVKDSTGSLIADAAVELGNDANGYLATLNSDRYGYAYFPTALPELVSGSYTLTIKATGFQDNISTVSISGLVSKNVTMVKN